MPIEIEKTFPRTRGQHDVHDSSKPSGWFKKEIKVYRQILAEAIGNRPNNQKGYPILLGNFSNGRAFHVNSHRPCACTQFLLVDRTGEHAIHTHKSACSQRLCSHTAHAQGRFDPIRMTPD